MAPPSSTSLPPWAKLWTPRSLSLHRKKRPRRWLEEKDGGDRDRADPTHNDNNQDADDDDEVGSMRHLQQEEAVLRTLAYHALARECDRVVYLARSASLDSGVVASCQRLIDSVTPPTTSSTDESISPDDGESPPMAPETARKSAPHNVEVENRHHQDHGQLQALPLSPSENQSSENNDPLGKKAPSSSSSLSSTLIKDMNKKKEDDGDHDNIDRNAFIIEASTAVVVPATSTFTPLTAPSTVHYHPLTLPLLLLDGPWCTLDRYAWMQHLARSALPQSRPRSCVVWIQPPVSTTSSSSDDYFWQEEILRQCQRQDEGATRASRSSHLLRRRQRKRLFQAAADHARRMRYPHHHQDQAHRLAAIHDAGHALVQWAAHATLFDDIVVLMDLQGMEHPSASSSNATNAGQGPAVVAWASDLRSRHGLPISLVLCRPHRQLWAPDLCTSSMLGTVGLMAQSSALPSSRHVLQQAGHNLIFQHDFPLLLPATEDSSLASLATASEDGSQQLQISEVSVLLDVKRALAQVLCRRGSFLLAARHASPDHRRHMAWFLIFPPARHYIHPGQLREECVPCAATSGLFTRLDLLQRWEQLELARRCALIALALLRDLGHEDVNWMLPLPLTGGRSSWKRLWTSWLPGATVTMARMSSSDRKRCLQRLLQFRHEASGLNITLAQHLGLPRHPHQSGWTKQYVRTIEELIIMVDASQSREDLYSELQVLLRQWTEACQKTGLNVDEWFQPTGTHLRRHTLRGLWEVVDSGNDDRENNSTLDAVPGLMLKVLGDRVFISQSEWFALLRRDSAEASPLLFACGVYFLKMLGLIQDKALPGKPDIYYEKCALVWCSGD